MNIRDAAFQLCKAVSGTLSRKQITDLNDKIHNGMVIHFGDQEHAQFLGYLMVNQERARYAEGPYPFNFPGLEDEQQQLLAAAHSRFTELNAQCVAPLAEALPNTIRAINPYSRYNYKTPTEFVEIDLLTDENISNMASSFHGHPQIAIAIESSRILSPHITAEVYHNDVLKMVGELEKEGPLKTPEWLRRVCRAEKHDSPHRTYIRHLAALASIRESLRTLDQLVFQKIFSEKLVVLDDDRIIAYGPYVSGTDSMAIIFQNAGLALFLSEDDIILAQLMALSSASPQLCKVEKLDPQIFHFPPGNPRYIEVRAIDEHLNPYGALVEGL